MKSVRWVGFNYNFFSCIMIKKKLFQNAFQYEAFLGVASQSLWYLWMCVTNIFWMVNKNQRFCYILHIKHRCLFSKAWLSGGDSQHFYIRAKPNS